MAHIKDAELCTTSDLSRLLDSSISLDDIHRGQISRVVLTNSMIDWLMKLANWNISVTLTFKEDKSRDVALAHFRRLIQNLNRNLVGENYTKLVGHSYFSYAFGIEYQTRDVIHFHLIADKPIDFAYIHGYGWGLKHGFAWTDIIRSREDCISYICKYNLKGGQVEFYKDKSYYVPLEKPTWWVGDNIRGSYYWQET